MKKLALALAATAALVGQATAADMAVKAARPVAPPVVAYNWTGCYISGGGGYGLFTNDHDQIKTGPTADATFPVGTVTQGNTTTGGRGWFGTVGGGCDYQFGGVGIFNNLLIGAFGDYSFTDLHGDYTTHGFNFADGSAEILTGRMKMTDNWAVGARLGWVVVPQFMTYFNAGYTEARFDGFNLFNTSAPFIGVNSNLAVPAQTHKGWFVGGGTEYAVGFLPGFFLRSEYRYTTFDGQSNGLNCLGASPAGPANPVQSCLGAGPSGWTDRSTVHSQMIKTELVWRFNWSGPAVSARY